MKSLLAVPRALGTPAQMRRFEELCARTEASVASLQRKRKRRRRGGRERLQKLLPVAALIVDIGSGISMAGYAGSVLSQCSLLLSTGLRCSASWPVCTRRTGRRSSSFIAVACAMLVFCWLRCTSRYFPF